MKEKIMQYFHRFLNKQLDFRVRLFNVLAMGGTVISLAMALAGIVTQVGLGNITVNFISAFLSYALLCYSQRTGRYQLCYFITIVVIFLGLFPVMFFTAGGYNSGMPSFFVFAVAFTILMLKGKKAIIMSVLEIILYIAICIIAFRYPEMVNAWGTEQELLTDVIVGFVSVSAVLGTMLFLHFKLYNEQQKQLTEQNVLLEQLNQMKTEFLGNVSHELKTPLTVMSGYAQSTKQLTGKQNAPVSEEVSRRMTLISAEAERLSLMVGQILDVTRMEEGRMVIERVRCYVDEIIHTAVETHYPILNKNQNRLDIRIESGLPAVHADSARISQVIVNLISNAVRYTTNGVITISAKKENDNILLRVSDTGVGIEAEQMQNIFERYSKKQKSGAGQDTGTGLGLYICKYIVEGHGGKIWIESKEGQGTSAFFTLPVYKE
jgi:signal transduction histidine kinase